MSAKGFLWPLLKRQVMGSDERRFFPCRIWSAHFRLRLWIVERFFVFCECWCCFACLLAFFLDFKRLYMYIYIYSISSYGYSHTWFLLPSPGWNHGLTHGQKIARPLAPRRNWHDSRQRPRRRKRSWRRKAWCALVWAFGQLADWTGVEARFDPDRLFQWSYGEPLFKWFYSMGS